MNIQCDNPVTLVVNPGLQNNIRNALHRAYTKCNAKFNTPPQLIVCVINDELREMSHKDIYTEIKRVTLSEAGVVSQCMLFKHVQSPGAIKDQYIANVALVLLTYVRKQM